MTTTAQPNPAPPEPERSRVRVRPWRSAGFGWAVAVIVLAGGVPLFLCLPPWIDVTLYDVAARNVLRGGVHYRDVFDTNLPGVVWVMAAVRAVCGWGYEALRAWDLLVMGAAAVLLGGWARRAGATPAAVAWYAAAVALFYPGISEFNHCQRDGWMLLPGVVAARMRLAALDRGVGGGTVSPGRSVVEGFVWGLAVWLKPHALIPAATVWCVATSQLARGISARGVAADAAGLVGGGLLAGLPGVVWLVATGAWPYFWDVFTRWNPEYMGSGVWDSILTRAEWTVWYFRPWSLMHLLALPVALRDIRTAPGQAGGVGSARSLLAGLYLGWFGQAWIVQRGFDYVHVPETILGMAVLAARGWAVGFPPLVWFVAVGGLLAVTDQIADGPRWVAAVNRTNHYLKLERHPLTDPDALTAWPQCWREGGTPELWDRLARQGRVHCAPNWVELDATAGFLRTITPQLRDRELTCWHDSTHPLYLMLDLQPSTRFLHFGTVFPLRGKVDEIRRAVAASPQRYVVSDLGRMTWDLGRADDPGAAGPTSLPAWFPLSQRVVFPWNQRVVFRAGRYVVYQVVRPPTADEIDIPSWDQLDELGPGE